MKPDKLTARQQEVLDFITSFTESSGAPPTVREIASAMGFASTNAVSDHLAAIERAGFIERRSNRSRGIRVTAQARTSGAGQIPILGRIAAGRPIYAAENLEGYLSPDPFFIRDTAETFVLCVTGRSMIGDGILDGDYIFVRRQPVADAGDIVVALIDDEATVKRYTRTSAGIALMPSNPDFKPIVVRPDDHFEILGVVTGVFRKM
ncbi:MAG TPA: transcriptional repressor LexA [Myxococcota bacterium]|nr:transcriptional repressor LexA [Myxococcota bacterium]HOH76468.1 transcriptional repressor LexA [Myxococcota bacterium]